MTLKRVKNYDLFATGDACVFSMAGEPQYMIAGLTPSKHYTGYIKHVDNMHREYSIVITDDNGRPHTLVHHADPVRAPVGLPLYFLMEVLMDKDTYLERLRTREKRDLRHAEKNYEDAKKKAQETRQVEGSKFDQLEDR